MDNSPYLRGGLGWSILGEWQPPKPRRRKNSSNSRKSSSSCKTSNSCTTNMQKQPTYFGADYQKRADPFQRAHNTIQLNFEKALQSSNHLKNRLKRCSRLKQPVAKPIERKCCRKVKVEKACGNQAYLHQYSAAMLEQMRTQNTRLKQLLLVRSLPSRSRP